MVTNHERDDSPLDESKSFSSILTQNSKKSSQYSINDCLSSINNTKNHDNETTASKFDNGSLLICTVDGSLKGKNKKSKTKTDRENIRLEKKKLAMEKSMLKKKERETKKIRKELERSVRFDSRFQSDNSIGHGPFQLLDDFKQQKELLDMRLVILYLLNTWIHGYSYRLKMNFVPLI